MSKIKVILTKMMVNANKSGIGPWSW